MIIANISTPLLGLVDTAVMGHLASADYLAAIALGSTIFTFLFWGFGFLRMATTGLIAQASGNNNHESYASILVQGLQLACLIAASLLILQTPIKQFAFYILESTPDVINHAQTYFDIRIWSAPAILVNYVFLGYLIGKAETRKALLLVLVVNIINIILDLYFVNILRMKADGVALASVFAEYVGLVAGLFLIYSNDISLRKLLNNSLKLSTLKDKKWLSLNGNIFVRTLCLISSFAFFTAQGAKQGETILAANALLLNFITFMAFVLDGFANAIEIITGKAIGANNQIMLRRGLLLGSFWAVIFACLFSLIYFLYGADIISLLTTIPDVVATASIYLNWLVVIPIIAVWSYIFDGLFIGATRSTEMRNTMLFASIFCYLPVWYNTQFMANHGLWLALTVFLAARGLAQAWYLPKLLQMK